MRMADLSVDDLCFDHGFHVGAAPVARRQPGKLLHISWRSDEFTCALGASGSNAGGDNNKIFRRVVMEPGNHSIVVGHCINRLAKVDGPWGSLSFFSIDNLHNLRGVDIPVS